MNLKNPLLLLVPILTTAPRLHAQATGEISQVRVADNGDGTYKNPILHADYSDPDAVRVGDDYIRGVSTFI